MGFVDEIKKELQPQLLLPSLTVGLLAGLLIISLEISLAALIFSGSLRQFLSGGIGLLLFGGLVMGAVVALTTSFPGMIALPQDAPAAILAVASAAIAFSMRAAPPQALYATVLAAIALTSLLMALVLLLLGHFRASGFVRYIPYPVVGGFLAGTGWLITKGGLGVMLDMPLTLANLPRLLAPEELITWVPGVIFGVALLFILRRNSHFLITPGALILTTALFYVFLLIARVPVAEASARGWLLGPFPSGGFYQPLTPAILPHVNWAAILGQAGNIATILVLSVVALLLNASALEVTVRQDIDLDRELITAGFANLAGGLGGSAVGYPALSLSALAFRLGARSRLVNLIAGLVCGVVLFFGASLVSYIPKVVLGGMLIYLGLSFLAEWLIDARRTLPVVDYVLVWSILVIIAVFGFLQGIGAGVLISAIIFVITYSRVHVIRNILNGRVFHSNVDRPKLHRDLLAQHGPEIYILRLQGFIFFGTIQTILNQIRARLNDKNEPKLGFIVLDFQRVTQLDSSAVFGITRLKQLSKANGVWMVWTQVSPDIHRRLQRGGLVGGADDSFIILPTLDHGVEWCENKILSKHGHANLTGFIERIDGQLKRAFPGLQAVDRLTKYLERISFAQGQYLMRQGEAPTEMYFIESGMVSAQLESPDGQLVRLQSMRGGTTVGEMGLYTGVARTASVVAARPTAAYRLSAEALKSMREQDPEVAAVLHEWVARLLAERLAANNATIRALME